MIHISYQTMYCDWNKYLKEWKREKEEEEKQKLAENNRYKQYRRFMKKGGPGQMVLGPE